jgi:hypothetical protein
MAGQRLPALLVVDEAGAPKAILPASQMIKILVPGYVVEAPTPAAVLEVAAHMAQARSPLVTIADKDKAGVRLLDVITASHLLDRLLAVDSA